MKKIYVCSPYRGDVETNIKNVKKYCWLVSLDGIPIAPHLYFTQFLDDDYAGDRRKGMEMGMELLKECDEIRVFTDEVTEGMIDEIKAAKELKIPIKFYNADRERINYDALIINDRIGIGYKTIIEEVMNPNGPKRICPYANNCSGSCHNTCEEKKQEAAVVQEAPRVEVVKEETKATDWRSRLLARFNRSH